MTQTLQEYFEVARAVVRDALLAEVRVSPERTDQVTMDKLERAVARAIDDLGDTMGRDGDCETPYTAEAVRLLGLAIPGKVRGRALMWASGWDTTVTCDAINLDRIEVKIRPSRVFFRWVGRGGGLQRVDIDPKDVAVRLLP